MARVTVEDCVDKIPNRFELILIAAQRARELAAGAVATIDRDNDKNPVVALREIAGESVEFPRLREAIVRGMQKSGERDEPDEEITEIMRQEQLLADQAANALAAGGEQPGTMIITDEDDDDDDDDADADALKTKALGDEEEDAV